MQIQYRDPSCTQPVRISMLKPTDMHQHLRQGDMLKLVLPMIARRFRSAIVMPNTIPPIVTLERLKRYQSEIKALAGANFTPFMTMYLTDELDPSDVRIALSSRSAIGIKYYPPGLTTNSESGVADPASLWTRGTKPYQCLQTLAQKGGVLLIHAADGFASGRWGVGNRTYEKGEQLDPYDQEKHFVFYTLPKIRDTHPELKISVEHLSTAEGVEFMRENGGPKLGCSLTAQHLLLDRRDSFRKGKQMGFTPHCFWWPIVQPKEHRDELRRFATEGHSFVWLGSDSAPHPVDKKETDCCTGGVLMAHAGIELYVEAFEDMGCLDKWFENFASVNGRTFFGVDEFYGLKPSGETVTLERKEWKVDHMFYTTDVTHAPNREETIVPFRLGETIRWKLVD